MLSISLLLILNKIFFDVSCGCFAILDVCSALTRVTTVFPKIYFFKLCFIASITKNLFPEVFDVILLWGLFLKKRSFACVLVLHHHWFAIRHEQAVEAGSRGTTGGQRSRPVRRTKTWGRQGTDHGPPSLAGQMAPPVVIGGASCTRHPVSCVWLQLGDSQPRH